MKYRPTPLNIVSGLVIGYSIYGAIYSGAEGWGILLLYYCLPFGLLGLLVDLFIQRFSKKYLWTFIIESSLIVFLFLCYGYSQRTKTLIIPDGFHSKYIVVIYNVNNAPKLPIGPFTWSYEIKIPANGILLTSSFSDNDLLDTKMKTYSGIELNTKSSVLGWVHFTCYFKKYLYIFIQNNFKIRVTRFFR